MSKPVDDAAEDADPAPPPLGPGDTIIVRHGGQEHEAVITGFAMGVKARLKNEKRTPVFVPHGEWRLKPEA